MVPPDGFPAILPVEGLIKINYFGLELWVDFKTHLDWDDPMEETDNDPSAQ